MIRKISIFVLAAFLAFPSVALAEAKVGDQIPHDLALKDQNGVVQSFEAMSGEKGMALVFVRSADWCPYCQVQLLDLREGAAPLIEMGYNVVTISYDQPGALKAFADKYNFPHVMLSDEGSEAIKAFGILNEEYEPDHFAYGVPLPHVYIIGQNKYIRAVLSEEGYKKRPQIAAIVEAIEGLE